MFRKKKEEIKKEIGFEERERKTPFLGYVLLIAMAFAVLFLGMAALDDLYDVPKKPKDLSSCSSSYVAYKWEDVWHRSSDYNTRYQKLQKPSGDCVFSELEAKYKTPEVFAETENLREEISDLKKELLNKQSSLGVSREDYGLGLLEDIAKKPGIFDSQKTQEEIRLIEMEVVALEEKIAQKELEFKPYEENLKGLYTQIQEEHRSLWRWHDFYAFLLQVVLVLPLFFILLRAYFKLSAKNSPYLIIFTFLLIPVSIFVLKIVFIYFWSLFLARILEAIWLLF